MSQFNEIFSEFEMVDSPESKPAYVKSNVKIQRICIFFTVETVPNPFNISESYSFLLYIPSILEGSGAISFKNIVRGTSKAVFIDNKKELRQEYIDAAKLWRDSSSSDLIYEGTINTDGVFAIPFQRIGMKVNE